MARSKHKTATASWAFAFLSAAAIIGLLITTAFFTFQAHYQGKVYPGVTIDGISFDGQTEADVRDYWELRNAHFPSVRLELMYDGKIATISGDDLQVGYDATTAAVQAYSVGRSSGDLSNIFTIVSGMRVNLTPYFRWDGTVVGAALSAIEEDVNIPARDALFTFAGGRVTAFKPSEDGRALDRKEAERRIHDTLLSSVKNGTTQVRIMLPVVTVHPLIATDRANTFGIKDKIATGYSEFAGSAAGRIHNVVLAASRLNGVLIPPGQTFSFNTTVGDISAATGYQSAYIIKDGHTVMGDGGGVCQVSTTLFRAALNAGLPIVERHAHDYRVHYYEEAGFKPGIDATVYNPTSDLRFTNDTPGYILIQTYANLSVPSLTFELYGTGDGRQAQVTNFKLWDQQAPPPDLYQDDPTIPKGTVKQVDFAAWGAKASFDYRVTRGSELLQNKTFTSTFRPWQAVYLRGTL